MNPLVSVVIPTHKRNLNYVERAVKSVMEQTYDNVEIVIVDDSPSDYEHRNDVRNYVLSLDKAEIQFVQNEKPIGGSLSRNKGIKVAKGEFVTFLDDDDEYTPRKVENQVKFMIESGCDMSFSNMLIYNNEGKVVDYREHRGIKSFDNETLLRYHLTKNLSGTPSFMFKTEKIREIGGFPDAKMGQEFMLMLRAIESGLTIRYFDGCDIKVYKHNDGRISDGRNKIEGEKALFEHKKKYFGILSRAERKYVVFRHKIVMAVAYKRNGMYGKMFGSAVSAFFTSPIYSVDEGIHFIKNIMKHS